MRILLWIIMVGSCVGCACNRYKQEMDYFYNNPTQAEIIEKIQMESLSSGSFN